jgi:hypothetical protein
MEDILLKQLTTLNKKEILILINDYIQTYIKNIVKKTDMNDIDTLIKFQNDIYKLTKLINHFFSVPMDRYDERP